MPLTSFERKIARLRREIEKIDAFFYGMSGEVEEDAWRLELKRDDMVRAVVLQLHTVIEDLLNIRIMNRILGLRTIRTTRGNSARALHRVFVGPGSIGFDMKLNLAVAIGLINSKTKERLTELNRLRNRCGQILRLRQGKSKLLISHACDQTSPNQEAFCNGEARYISHARALKVYAP
jgi:hypothetical protein